MSDCLTQPFDRPADRITQIPALCCLGGPLPFRPSHALGGTSRVQLARRALFQPYGRRVVQVWYWIQGVLGSGIVVVHLQLFASAVEGLKDA